MILKLSNDEFNFEPLLRASDRLLFETEGVSKWFRQQQVQIFDDVHLFLAGFFVTCTKHNFSTFVSNLNTLMIHYGILINHARLQYCFSAILTLFLRSS